MYRTVVPNLTLISLIIIHQTTGQPASNLCSSNLIVDGAIYDNNTFVLFLREIYVQAKLSSRKPYPISLARGPASVKYGVDYSRGSLDSVAHEGQETFFFRGEELKIYTIKDGLYTYSIYEEYGILNHTVENRTILSVDAAARTTARSLLVVKHRACSLTGCVNYTSQHYIKGGTETEIKVTDDTVVRTPTAMTYIESDSENDKMLLFFGPFWEIRTVPKDFSHLLSINNQNNYGLVDEWFQCPATLCFDAAPDDIDFDERWQNFHWYRGLYFWTFKRFEANVTPSGENSIRRYYPVEGTIDAVHSVGNAMYFVLSDRRTFVYNGSSGRYELTSSMFVGVKTPVDAVVEFDGITYVLAEQEVLEFERLASGKYQPLNSSRSSSSLATTMPKNIDGVVRISDNVLLFVRQNFYFEYEKQTKLMSEPRVLQGSLFRCSDDFYNKNTNYYLNISTLEQFVNYKLQVITETKQESLNASNSVLIVAGVVLSLFLLMAFSFCLFSMNTKKVQSSLSRNTATKSELMKELKSDVDSKTM
ncbi:hypothetical protein HDE_08923 [Halotydeus destructor]|nr:hypothetical protein HDE_08923 [Halotydeus destructor]